MRKALAALRVALVWAVLTACLVTAGVTLSPVADAATKTYTASTSVNVRTGPSTSKTILTQLQDGDTVLAAGSVSDSWLPISYDNTTAYVWASYLDKDATASSVVLTGPAGRRTTLAKAKAYAKASTDAAVTATATKGTAVTVTGYSSGDFAQVTVDDDTAWIHSDALSDSTDTTPVTVATYTTTTSLALRSTASVTACSSTSASEWPSSACVCGMRTPHSQT